MSHDNKNRQAAFQLNEIEPQAIDLYHQVPYRIAVTSNLLAIDRDAQVQKLTELDTRSIRVLLNIGSYGPINAANIAYQSRLDPYSVTRAVNSLLKQGYIEANNDHAKQRSKEVKISELGLPIYQKLAKYMTQRTEELLSDFSQQEQSQLLILLEKLELKAEKMLADNAETLKKEGHKLTRDQEEQIRWYKRTQLK